MGRARERECEGFPWYREWGRGKGRGGGVRRCGRTTILVVRGRGEERPRIPFCHGLGHQKSPRRREAFVGGGEGMPYSTGQGMMCQISLAYSAMVRSVLNLPELAMFIRHMRDQRAGSSYTLAISACLAT